MNVLITSASRKVGLVRAFQQALGRQGGGRVVAVDASPLAAALYEADVARLAPYGLDDGTWRFIAATCRELGVGLLVPTRDEELPFFAERAGQLRELGVLAAVAAPETVRVCQDKRTFIGFCADHDFGYAPLHTEPGGLAADDFPVFVRPRFGKGSRGAARVGSAGELESLLAREPDLVIQQFIDAPEYTVDLFADFDSVVASTVPRRRLSVFGGESFIARTERQPRIIDECNRLAAALGLVGHNTIQCFLDGEVVRFIEVNPRFGGGATLGFAAGAPSPDYLVRLAKGEPLGDEVGDFEDGLTMLRYTRDLFVRAGDLVERTG